MLPEKISVYNTDSQKSCIHCSVTDAGTSSPKIDSWDEHLLSLISNEMLLAAEGLLKVPVDQYWHWGKGQRGRSESCKDASGLDARVTVAYHFEPGFEHPAAAAYELDIANEDGTILRLFSATPPIFSGEAA